PGPPPGHPARRDGERHRLGSQRHPRHLRPAVNAPHLGGRGRLGAADPRPHPRPPVGAPPPSLSLPCPPWLGGGAAARPSGGWRTRTWFVSDARWSCSSGWRVRLTLPYRSLTSLVPSRAGSPAGSASDTHVPVFHAGTGVSHPSSGTNFEGDTRRISW